MTTEDQFKFIIDHNLVQKNKACPHCLHNCKLIRKDNKLFWLCRKRSRVDGKNVTKCYFKQSIFKNSWFENSHLPIQKHIMIIKRYLEPTFEGKKCIQELKINKNTMSDYISFSNQVIIGYMKINYMPIGGETTVVLIDITKFRQRGNDGLWVMCGIELNSQMFFLTHLEDLTKETFTSVIERMIKPGTTITGNFWNNGKSLIYEIYEDLKLKHGLNFLDAHIISYAVDMSAFWKYIRSLCPRYGKKKCHFHAQLLRVMFIKQYPDSAMRNHKFWLQVAKMFY